MAQKAMHTQTSKGFTLIEMSIVLVIIGLLAGSIFVGKTLISQAKLNSVMTDEQHYIQATLAFQQKYGALPGDFAGATSNWGIAAGSTGNDSTCQAATGTAPATCNGNGDGQIYNPTNTTPQNINETLRYWQHLVDAQLISGSYSGVPGTASTPEHDIGTNCPETKVSSGGFGIEYAGIVNSSTTTGDYTDFPNGTYGHVFIFGGFAASNLPVAPIITSAEAAGIDTKYDDGLPNSGNILTWNITDTNTGYASSCAYLNTAVTPNALEYNTPVAGPVCSLIMVTGF